MTLSFVVESLLKAEAGDLAFEALHQELRNFPHDEHEKLEQLFGSIILICGMALEYDSDQVTQASADLLHLWRAHSSTLAN